MFQLDTSGRTRGHAFKLIKYRCNKDVRKFFFSHRVVSRWNMLDDNTVTAKVTWKKNVQRRWVSLWTDVCSTPRPSRWFRSGHPASILQVYKKHYVRGYCPEVHQIFTWYSFIIASVDSLMPMAILHSVSKRQCKDWRQSNSTFAKSPQINWLP